MLTHNLGYPRIGGHRELKKANEQYWAGKITAVELEQTAKFLIGLKFRNDKKIIAVKPFRHFHCRNIIIFFLIAPGHRKKQINIR